MMKYTDSPCTSYRKVQIKTTSIKITKIYTKEACSVRCRKSQKLFYDNLTFLYFRNSYFNCCLKCPLHKDINVFSS